MGGVKQAIQRVEDMLIKSNTNPVLSAVIGLRRPPASRRIQSEVTHEETIKAKSALINLEKLPIDEIRLKLTDERLYSVRELRAIASAVGIRSTKGIDRAGLVHRIATKIANYRGYQSLSGTAMQPNGTPKLGDSRP